MAWRKLAGIGGSVLLLTFWIWWLRPSAPDAAPAVVIEPDRGEQLRTTAALPAPGATKQLPAHMEEATAEANTAPVKSSAIREAETARCLTFNNWRDWSRDWHRRLTPERSLALRNWMSERGLVLPDPDGRASPQHSYAAYDLATLKTLAANDDVVAKKFLAQRLRSEQPRGSQEDRRLQREKQADEREQLLMDVAASGDIGALFELRNLARERLAIASSRNDTERARRYAAEAEGWARVAEWRGGFRDNNELTPRERESLDASAISTVTERLSNELKQRRQQQGRGEFDNSVLADYETWRGQWRKVTSAECRGFQQEQQQQQQQQQQQTRAASATNRRE